MANKSTTFGTHLRAFFALSVLVTLTPAQITGDHPGLQAAEKLVVMIQGSLGYGAGVVVGIDERYVYIATMFHVVRQREPGGGEDVRASNLTVRFRQSPNDPVTATHFEDASPEHDLAVIRVPLGGRSFNLARLGNPAGLTKGTFAYAIGQPEGERWGVTYQPASVSAIGSIWLRLQTALIQNGHSGGALIDQEGRIIGLVKQTGGATAQALRIDHALAVLRQDLNVPVQLAAAEAVDSHQPVVLPSKPQPLAAGTSRTNPKDGLSYVWIPDGSFRMGCSEAPKDPQCDKEDEFPTHTVAISKGFWMGQTEVTQQAYRKVTGKNPSHFKGPQRPVESVSWDEAKAYCATVGLRLPTEADWEYAARAGSRAAQYGDLNEIAWYRSNSNSTTYDVGLQAANAWGLKDMLGNVWEWTADWYDASYYAKTPAKDPSGPTSGNRRVLRGGSWDFNPGLVRVSVRFRGVPSVRVNYIGFRCAGEFR